MSLSTPTWSLNNLPNEVLSYIFEFIPYPYIQDVRLVCRLWYQLASQNTHVLDKEQVVCCFSSGKPTVILESSRAFFHLKIQHVCDNTIVTRSSWKDWFLTYNPSFWESIGPKIMSLALQQCWFTHRCLLEILKLCPRIKSLEIINCPVDSEKGDEDIGELNFPCLESLLIQGMYAYAGGDLFKKLVSSSPKLKSVELSDCLVEGDYQRGPVLTRDVVIECMKEISGRLNAFGLMLEDGNDSSVLADLFEAEDLKLQTLITNCKFPIEDFSAEVVSFQLSYLQELVFVPTNVTAREMEIICNLELKSLQMDVHSGNVTLLNKLPNLLKLENLRLYLREVDREAADLALMGGLCSQGKQSLKTLSLGGWFCSPRTIASIARCHPGIETLKLAFFREHGVDDVSIQAIFKYMVRLENLSLEVGDVTNAGIHGVRVDVKDLEENPTGFSISRLKRLRVLALLNCQNKFSLPFEIAPTLPELLSLSIDISPVKPTDIYDSTAPRKRGVAPLPQNHQNIILAYRS